MTVTFKPWTYGPNPYTCKKIKGRWVLNFKMEQTDKQTDRQTILIAFPTRQTQSVIATVAASER